MNIFNSSRYIQCLLLGLLGSITASEARAQTNNPNLSQTTVPGTSTVTIPVPAYQTKSRVNFSRTFVPKVRLTDASQLNLSTTPDKAVVSTEYTNGQGNTEQKVLRNTYKTSGGAYRHTIVPIDTRSIADRYSFMAYPSTEGSYNQSAYWGSVNYHNGALYPEESGGLATDAVMSVGLTQNSSTTTERSITSYAPGKSRIGQGRGTKTMSISNLGFDAAFKPDANIRTWTISAGMPVSSTIYAAGTLNGSRTINADGAEKIIFQDMSGKTVYEYALAQQTVDGFGNTVKTHSVTYYVYDLFGRLRFTISPKGVDAIKSNWTMTSDILRELCFEYQYDAKGRQVAVHKPGETGFTELVYDKVGKTVMRRSPLEAAQQKWELVFYDNSNRVIATGLLSNDNQSRSYWQAQAQSLGSAGTGTPHYYIWGAGKGTLPPLTGINNTEILSYNYYDSYSSTPLSSETFSNTLIQPYLSSAPNADAYVQGPSTYGRLTATAVKVIKAPGASTGLQDWTYSKVFYDSLGRVIYSVNQHAGGLKDSSATQYSYTGQVLFNVLSHNAGTTSGNKRSLQLTSNSYEDYSDRLLQSSRKTNDQAWEPMASYTYNELGQVATKTLGNEAETQTFTYTVRGELRGINEQYALTGDNGEKGITFGEALRYDYGFQLARYDGQATGMVWRGSGGTNVKANAYGYWYDRIGRMTMAEHVEAASTGGVPTSWNNTGKNFTESVTYDINGNITKLNRSGMALISGTYTAVALDRLTYTYQANSNKIDKVTDANASNYPEIGDFKQGTAQGYSYDVSGNLVEDKSKSITSISYTFFNKPQVISFSNGNRIWYSYDASGAKIQELMLEGSTTTKLNYLGNGVYQDDVLQYLGTAEGRTDMRKATPQEQYYVKDHLGNIRSIVASAVVGGGTQQMAEAQSYTATYELANANTEEQLFENVSEVREDNPESTSSTDTKAAELDGSQADKMVGTMILLKVMSGDKLNISTQSLYNSLQGTPANSDESSLVDHIVSSVAGMAGSLPAGETGMGADMANQMFSSTEAQDAYFALQQSAADSTRPQAFLNYLFFDEDMKLQPDHSQLWQADGEQQWADIGMAETETLEVPMNGYIAVYLTNQSQEETYFNNLSVILDPGVLIEEKHYYAYGLPISGMGSTAAGALANRKRYQGNEFREELGLKWMDFNNRQYDPQLGRFLSVDPLADAGGQQTMSPYHAMGCNPVLMVDPLGLMAGDPFTRAMPFLQISSAWASASGGPRGSNVASSMGAEWDNAGMWAMMMGKIKEALADRGTKETSFATNTPDGSAGVEENQTQGGGSLNGQGVDYTFDGTTISTETVANGLDHNRIVTRHTRGKNKGKIKQEVSLEDRKLDDLAEGEPSRYMFTNFGDGAISVWEFLAKNSGNEWGLTEYKLNGTVYSRIISKASSMGVGKVAGRELNTENITGLSYWISVHSHPMGGNGLSDNRGNDPTGRESDIYTSTAVRAIYQDAKFNAYDMIHLYDARSYIEFNRK